jgi:dTDP-4-amino-4,6-dideoxygalactose transaminase
MNNIPLFKTYFRKEEVLSEIGECLDSGWTGIGYQTEEFERLWCDYSKFNYRHFLNSTDNKINNPQIHLNISGGDVSCIPRLTNKFTL